jgi:alpha-galactosidase
MKRPAIAVGTAACLLLAATGTPAATLRLEELSLDSMSAGWGKPQKNQAVTGKPMSVGGERFEHGVGTHAASECWVALDGRTKQFTARVGVDDHAGSAKASLEFIVYGDGRELWRSGVCRMGEKARSCKVDLRGVTGVELVVTDAGDGMNYDHADWAEAMFEYEGTAPTIPAPAPVNEKAVLLTPPAPAEPRINGPKLCGVRPGSPFLYRIPATGERPMTFAAEGLPAGLQLDAATGIITGRVAAETTVETILTARNARGENRRPLRIVAGRQLALTPPMGWNSWYIHYNRVSDAVMRQAADQMVATGMADYGYQYVNIDDCWMVKTNSGDPTIGGATRDAAGRLLTNRRFGDMKSLTDYIHARGLKAGIYISPGPATCAGYEGSFGHEEQDARTFAEWGFDFLKYDWCSYGGKAGGKELEHLQKPYRQMWGILQTLDRDIVFNLCQYGMGEVWKWGGEVGHCWRTTGDLGLARGSRLPGFFSIGLSNAQHWEYARPGAWNDPDYILIGWVGDAHTAGEGVRTTLTPSEQYAYMSMWSLMAAPLVFSGDMARLDPFTLNVLCNHEVIDVNQDSLGRQARIARQTRHELVLVKELEDGAQAVGLFNLGEFEKPMSIAWEELGQHQPQRVRDLWRQKDLGSFDRAFETTVPRHGVAMLKIGIARQASAAGSR